MVKLIAVLCALAALGSAHAQQFPLPGKPIRIIVPFTPGGATDLQARAIAQKMSASMGIPVTVENKPGGSTVIGAREVQTAAPDGHTLLYTITTHVQIPLIFSPAPFDTFKDFTPITAGGLGGTVLTVHTSVPASSIRELIAHAKANPGKLSYASFGTGSTAHLNGEMLKRVGGIDIVHVPYKGAGDASRDVLGGQVQLFFDGVNTAINNAKTGKIRMLAAATDRRIPLLPDLPTLREQGLDIGIDGFLAFFGPAGMPPAVVDAVYRELAKAIATQEVKDIFFNIGYATGGMPPAEFARLVRSLQDRWGAVIRELGIKIEQ
ncbi:MAG: Bug family tripartite tricarboxylate transporter substrate binding protein [Betaproteobacteria bacterium]